MGVPDYARTVLNQGPRHRRRRPRPTRSKWAQARAGVKFDYAQGSPRQRLGLMTVRALSTSGSSAGGRRPSTRSSRALRDAGFAAWARDSRDGFDPHIHAILIGLERACRPVRAGRPPSTTTRTQRAHEPSRRPRPVPAQAEGQVVEPEEPAHRPLVPASTEAACRDTARTTRRGKNDPQSASRHRQTSTPSGRFALVPRPARERPVFPAAGALRGGYSHAP